MIIRATTLAIAILALAAAAGCSSGSTSSSSSGTSGTGTSGGTTSGGTASGGTTSGGTTTGTNCQKVSTCINGACTCGSGPNKDQSCQKTDSSASDFCDTFCKFCQ